MRPSASELEERWPRAVLFDLDGTLADSFPIIQQALAAALSGEGLPPRSLAWVRQHVGRGAEALIRDAVGERADGACVERVRRRYMEAYNHIPLAETPPAPGAAEALAFVWARTEGGVAVVSNKVASWSSRWLAHWGLAGFVAVVSGPDVSGALKPDPAAVTGVLAALGVDAASALLVGDMGVDAATGAAAGSPVVLVGEGKGADPPGVVGRLESLHDLPLWLVHNGRGWR